MQTADAKLNQLLRNQLKQRQIFNVVIGVQTADGSFSWSGAGGVADPEREAAMRVDSPYFIASVTKIFTAAAVMLLHEQGRLRLEDPVSRFVAPDVLGGLHQFRGTNYAEQLKVHHLLGHTSGLADYFEEKDRRGKTFVQTLLEEGDADWTQDDLFARVRTELSAKFGPASHEGSGNKAHYSDTNYQLLGSILTTVQETSFGQLLHDLLFAPLGLRDTYVFGEPRAAAGREEPATMYHGDRPFVVPKAMRAFGPNGGMVSTVADQLSFLKALFGGRVFSKPETLERMQQWNKLFFPVEYGFGLMRYELPRWMSPFDAVPEFVGHSGSVGSFAFYCRERDFYVAGTVNQLKARSSPFRLMPRIASILQKAGPPRS